MSITYNTQINGKFELSVKYERLEACGVRNLPCNPKDYQGAAWGRKLRPPISLPELIYQVILIYDNLIPFSRLSLRSHFVTLHGIYSFWYSEHSKVSFFPWPNRFRLHNTSSSQSSLLFFMHVKQRDCIFIIVQSGFNTDSEYLFIFIWILLQMNFYIPVNWNWVPHN